MDRDTIYDTVATYYSEKLQRFGPTANGVDWKDESSQMLRFEQLSKLFENDSDFSLCDWGCGYGALLDYLCEKKDSFKYIGFDWSETMIAEAKRSHAAGFDSYQPQWFSGERFEQTCDYIIASGIFNVRLGQDLESWQDYVFETLSGMNKHASKGFAFNMLTSFSDADRMRGDLYYPSPSYIFEMCKTRFSKYVALLHDYPLYEFTVLVRK